MQFYYHWYPQCIIQIVPSVGSCFLLIIIVSIQHLMHIQQGLIFYTISYIIYAWNTDQVIISQCALLTIGLSLFYLCVSDGGTIYCRTYGFHQLQCQYLSSIIRTCDVMISNTFNSRYLPVWLAIEYLYYPVYCIDITWHPSHMIWLRTIESSIIRMLVSSHWYFVTHICNIKLYHHLVRTCQWNPLERTSLKLELRCDDFNRETYLVMLSAKPKSFCFGLNELFRFVGIYISDATKYIWGIADENHETPIS